MIDNDAPRFYDRLRDWFVDTFMFVVYGFRDEGLKHVGQAGYRKPGSTPASGSMNRD